MEKMIKEYEMLYDRIVERIETLQKILETEQLRYKEHDRLVARINALKEERFELVLTIHELKQHR